MGLVQRKIQLHTPHIYSYYILDLLNYSCVRVFAFNSDLLFAVLSIFYVEIMPARFPSTPVTLLLFLAQVVKGLSGRKAQIFNSLAIGFALADSEK
jgi:hypothetical protein